MLIHFNQDFVASKYAFDTTRKSDRIALSLINDPIENADLADPGSCDAATESTVRAIHESRYVDAVRTGTPRGLAERQGFDWDPGIFTMALAHSHGLCTATRAVIAEGGTAGSLSSGLHHASHRMGAGYCTFNGLAAAATTAFDSGAERVLVLDFDAHCGGGTFDIMSDTAGFVQVDVSTSLFDTWEPTGEHFLRSAGSDNYVSRIGEALDHARSLGTFDLVIYNAGMDPINTGVSVSDVRTREKLVREFVGDTPAVFALAGGYTWGNHDMDELVSWHRMTIREWAQA